MAVRLTAPWSVLWRLVPVTLETGQVVRGELAAYLASTGAPVEQVEPAPEEPKPKSSKSKA